MPGVSTSLRSCTRWLASQISRKEVVALLLQTSIFLSSIRLSLYLVCDSSGTGSYLTHAKSFIPDQSLDMVYDLLALSHVCQIETGCCNHISCWLLSLVGSHCCCCCWASWFWLCNCVSPIEHLKWSLNATDSSRFHPFNFSFLTSFPLIGIT